MCTYLLSLLLLTIINCIWFGTFGTPTCGWQRYGRALHRLIIAACSLRNVTLCSQLYDVSNMTHLLNPFKRYTDYGIDNIKVVFCVSDMIHQIVLHASNLMDVFTFRCAQQSSEFPLTGRLSPHPVDNQQRMDFPCYKTSPSKIRRWNNTQSFFCDIQSVWDIYV